MSPALIFQTSKQISDSKVVDVTGKSLDAQTVLKRLQEPTPVLVFVLGKTADPYCFYFQLINKDEVLIVLRLKNNSGDDVRLLNRSDKLLHNLSMNVSEPIISALELIRQSFMMDAHLMQ